jgi:hypothetical protein
MHLVAVLSLIGSVAAAQTAVAPVFARYGIHASVAEAATVRNDGPHRVTAVNWIWWGTTSGGSRIPMGVHQSAGIQSGDSLITAPPRPVMQFTTVEASLDSVVLNNEMVLGPDEFGVIEARRAADAATAEIAARLNDPSLSDAQLNHWLQEAGDRRLLLKPNGLPDHSNGGTGTMALTVKQQIEQHGRAKVAALFAEVAKRNAAAKPLVSVRE